MAVVQAFNRERRFQAEFDELNDANRAQATYVQKIFSVFFPSIEFLGVVAMGTVLYFGSHLYEHGTLPIGTLIMAISSSSSSSSRCRSCRTSTGSCSRRARRW